MKLLILVFLQKNWVGQDGMFNVKLLIQIKLWILNTLAKLAHNNVRNAKKIYINALNVVLIEK